MPDVHDVATRSRNMAAVRGADTKPELLIRKGLHREGFRFRLHGRDLPGRPDIVLPKHGAALFLHGCFWHRHNCHLFRFPATREEFWRAKLDGNAARDLRARDRLREGGWRVGVVWECSIRGRGRTSVDQVVNRLAKWLRSGKGDIEISGVARPAR
jgi:DNA mismatch endonuclease (patch repair protein)